MQPIDDDDLLGVALRALAGVFTVADADAALTVCVRAARQLSGADHASVTAIAGSSPRTLASSDSVAAGIDAMQYALGDGPCLEAARSDQQVTADVVTDPRWTPLRSHVLRHSGVRYVVSLPLGATSPEFAAASLNLYSTLRIDPGPRTEIVAGLCASAVGATAERRRLANLERALDSARTIGAAVGVLMAARKITYDDAFELLRQASQDSHRKLRDLADIVLMTGDLG